MTELGKMIRDQEKSLRRILRTKPPTLAELAEKRRQVREKYRVGNTQQEKSA